MQHYGKELYDLIGEFKDSEFYKIISTNGTNVRILKSLFGDFLVSARVDLDGSYAILTTTSRKNKKICMVSAFNGFRLCSDISLRTPLNCPPKYKEEDPICNLSWKVDKTFAVSFFQEALEIVKKAQELEKKGKYFVGAWDPSFLQRNTILFSHPGSKIISALPREEIEKIFDENIRSLFQEHVQTLDGEAFFRVASAFADLKFPVFKKSMRTYPTSRFMKKKVRVMIDSVLRNPSE